MKVLRIKLRQNMASYTRPETVNNRMTYPLPMYSTVIGALHNACGYTRYHPMNICVQGKYSSMQKEVYIGNRLLDKFEDDRGNLIWLHNPNMLNSGYIRVAEALKGTGNSFKNDITIRVYNSEKIMEYRNLYKRQEELKVYEINEIKPKEEEYKEEEKRLKAELDTLEKNSAPYKALKQRINEIREKRDLIRSEYKRRMKEEYENPISHFKTLIKRPETQEVLYDVELVLHIHSDDATLEDIIKNKNNFVALGRSEDFVEISDMRIVEISDDIDGEYALTNGYAIFADLHKVQEELYFIKSLDGKKGSRCTIYEVSKNYEIEDKKRKFHHITCMYSSGLSVDEESSGGGVYIDKADDGEVYIVDLN